MDNNTTQENRSSKQTLSSKFDLVIDFILNHSREEGTSIVSDHNVRQDVHTMVDTYGNYLGLICGKEEMAHLLQLIDREDGHRFLFSAAMIDFLVAAWIDHSMHGRNDKRFAKFMTDRGFPTTAFFD